MNSTTDLHEQVEIIDKQSTIILGTIGHVSHGKTTLVKQLTGIKTNQHSKEQILGITIKLGYANCKIFECDNLLCPCRYETLSQFRDHFPQQSEQVLKQCHGKPVHRYTCPHCLEGTKLLKRHVSFVDCPGHEAFLLTMLNGANVMDNALLLISAARQDYNTQVEFPMPQTLEHLVAADLLLHRKQEIDNRNRVIVCQNKLDVCQSKQMALKQYQEIKTLCQAFECTKNSPVIPILAQQGFNMSVLLEEIVNMPVPTRDITSPLHMPLIRSFNLNKPGCEVADLLGGVLGGTISCGTIAKGDLIELRPGIIEVIENEDEKRYICRPILTKVQMLFCENTSLEKAYPGGLIAVGTNIDPTLCKEDRLVGQVVVHYNAAYKPPIANQLQIHYNLLDRTRLFEQKNKFALFPLSRGESIFVTAGSKSCVAKILQLNEEKREIIISLETPICMQKGDCISFSRRSKHMFCKKDQTTTKTEMRWRLAGYATILEGSLYNTSILYSVK